MGFPQVKRPFASVCARSFPPRCLVSGKLSFSASLERLKQTTSFLPFDKEMLMRRLHRICVMLYLLVCAGTLCVADTTADLRSVFTFMPSPQYPPEAWWRASDGWRRIEGITVCCVSLDAKGAVTGVQIIKSSGNKALDFASTEALRHWRARLGRPGRFFDIPINFTSNHSPQAPGSNQGNLGDQPAGRH